MLHSIQEILKIINNRITLDILWILTSIFLLFTGYFVGLSENYYRSIPEVQFMDNSPNDASDKLTESEQKGRIFGSSKGKYYYYEGCGGNSISPKNLVYYTSEAHAESLGKKLYKSCE